MALVKALLEQFPDCDRMMAETIVKAHENGTLEDYLPLLEGRAAARDEQKNSGSITIEQWSEDKSAASSSSTAQ